MLNSSAANNARTGWGTFSDNSLAGYPTLSVLERTRELLLQKALTPAPFEKLAAIAAPKTRPIARRTTTRMAKPLREAICEQLAPRGITISQAAELGAALHELFECELRGRQPGSSSQTASYVK